MNTINRRSLVIPKNLVDKIIKSKKINEISTYLVLSSLYEGKVIKNFYSRLKELAAINGTTKKTLKKHISILEKDKLVRFIGKHLFICKKSTLCEYFGVKQSYYFKHVIDKKYNNRGVKLLLRAISIEENKNKQVHKIKIRSEQIKDILELKRRNNLELDGVYYSVNRKVELSQKGLSKNWGLKSKSSANYHIKNLVNYEFVINRKNEPKFISKGGRNALLAIRDENPTSSYFVSNKGYIYQNVPNTLVVRNF